MYSRELKSLSLLFLSFNILGSYWRYYFAIVVRIVEKMI